MTFGRSPVQLARIIERHVRNSHAIGRLVVGGVLARVPIIRNESPKAPPEPAAAQTAPMGESTSSGLPLPESEWKVLSSGDVVEIVRRSDAETVRAIGRFEETHRRRRLVIEAVRQKLDQ